MTTEETPKSSPGSALPDGAHTDFSEELSYGSYLRLPQLLDCQRPLSDSHDETLFIIIHQATELWMKLVVHELAGAISHIHNDDLAPAFKMLARVSRIQSQLIQSWDVLATLTPSDYLAFRDRLGHASGFQSYQYRTIKFLLGNKNPKMLEPHRHDPAIFDALSEVLDAPSLYDETIRLLERRGFAIDDSCLERPWRLPREINESVREA